MWVSFKTVNSFFLILLEWTLSDQKGYDPSTIPIDITDTDSTERVSTRCDLSRDVGTESLTEDPQDISYDSRHLKFGTFTSYQNLRTKLNPVLGLLWTETYLLLQKISNRLL